MSFDTLAPFYRLMEALAAGEKLQRCRTRYLDEIPAPQRILLAGEGHGRFLPECAKRFPDARITVVDSSSRMLQISAGKVDSPLVEFVHADLLTWDHCDRRFDLIVANFFLDCFPPNELEKAVSQLGALATPAAHFLLADFEITPAGPSKWRSQFIVSLLYRFFRLVTGLQARALVPPDDDLKLAGFSLHRRTTHDWGLLKSEWWTRTGK